MSFVVVTCVSLLVVWLSIYLWKKSQARVPTAEQANSKLKPEKWVKVGRVSKLFVFPVKSCAGVELDKAVVTTLALKCHNSVVRDRDFVVVNDIGKQMDMEKYPRMVLIKFDVQDGNKLIFTAPDMPPLTFTVPTPNGDNETVCKVHHDRNVKVLDCGDDVAQWLQEFLGDSTLRLYYHHVNNTQRTFTKYMYKCPQFEPTDMGSFQNETSYLLMSQESIEDLNKHIEKDSSWLNWRPNILIDQVDEPFAELNWNFVKIGNDAILKTSAPCGRCPLTTVDNELGVMPSDGEPLKTLKSLKGEGLLSDERLKSVFKGKGLMGIRLGVYLPAGEGHVIKIGDPVYAAIL